MEMFKWEVHHFFQSIYDGIDKVKSFLIPIALILPLWLIPVSVLILSIPYRILTVISRIFSVLICSNGRQEQTFDESDDRWDINHYATLKGTFWGRVKAVLFM